MDYDDTTLADAVASLDSDGDTYELPDGRTLRLVVEADEDFDAGWSDDCYGRISWAGCNRREQRPDDFDGNAEKLTTQHEVYWWQPPADGPKRGTEEFRAFRHLVSDLVAYGFVCYGVELVDGTDAYGAPIVVGAGWLGGCEPFDKLDSCLLRDLVEQAVETAEVRTDVIAA